MDKKSKFLLTLLLTFTCLVFASTQSQSQLPANFSWANINNVSYIGPVRNQNFPNVCNSGWAFSTINMLESRIKRMRNASSPDISLSVQVLLSCDTFNYGCMGGEPINALRYIVKNQITDETCKPYLAKGYTNGEQCTSQTKCQSCTAKDQCKSQRNSKIYGSSHYGNVGSMTPMMQQIQRYGPIACGIYSSPQFQNYTSGIFRQNTTTNIPNHYVMIYGWGQENGTRFWYGRNSWGSNWGQQGNFRILRGQNTAGIQSSCVWSSAWNVWVDDQRNTTLPNQNLQNIESNNIKGTIKYQLPKFLTSSRSELTPHYCDASWAFSVTQMLSDRLYKSSKGKIIRQFSIQSLLNCGVGSCEKGGNPFDTLVFMHKYGTPDEGCQTYGGVTPTKQSCSAINNCASCNGTVFNSKCTQVKNYKRWKLIDYGTLNNVDKMKQQITNYGPIVCGIQKTTTFQKYDTGIFSQVSVAPKINHYVQIVGFGSQNGANYWIGRNSWGTAWGQQGFFRIKMGSNILGVEKQCYWGNMGV